MVASGYRGRFAPSPSGALHLGSLVAALGSYAEARQRQGLWHLRIDDIDPPRVQPGAVTAIQDCLRAFGFIWDGPVQFQSAHTPRYQAALENLLAQARLFACRCSRQQISRIARQGLQSWIYPGTCREAGLSLTEPFAWRIKMPACEYQFDDRIQGLQSGQLANDFGDLVLRRADGTFAYQLATAVDDGFDGMTEVIRGADLLADSAIQIFLQQCLGYSSPNYAHLPVLLGADGRKLSKQNLAAPLDLAKPLPQLRSAWGFLGQQPPPVSLLNSADFWRWAIPNWQLARVPRQLGAGSE